MRLTALWMNLWAPNGKQYLSFFRYRLAARHLSSALAKYPEDPRHRFVAMVEFVAEYGEYIWEAILGKSKQSKPPLSVDGTYPNFELFASPPSLFCDIVPHTPKSKQTLFDSCTNQSARLSSNGKGAIQIAARSAVHNLFPRSETVNAMAINNGSHSTSWVCTAVPIASAVLNVFPCMILVQYSTFWVDGNELRAQVQRHEDEWLS